MSEQETQGLEVASAEAVIIAEDDKNESLVTEQQAEPIPKHEGSQEGCLEAQTTDPILLEDAIADVAGSGFVAKRAQPPVTRFVPRDQTDFVYHRKLNKDGSFDFFIADATVAVELAKDAVVVTTEPVGLDVSDNLIAALVKETEIFFAALDDSEHERRPSDQSDLANLRRLRDFVTPERSLHQLLTNGINAINIGSRLIQRTRDQIIDRNDMSTAVSGMITVRYQVEGHGQVFKYRLVGDISKELISELTDAVGNTEVMQEIFDCQPSKKPGKTKPAKSTEKQASPKVHQEAAADPKPKNIGNDTLAELRRLSNMVEALMIDQRSSSKKIADLTHTCSRLSADNRALRELCEEIRDQNDSSARVMDNILQSLGS